MIDDRAGCPRCGAIITKDSYLTHACTSEELTGSIGLKESVNHPSHYGGRDNPYEAIKVIEAWGLGFCLGNAVKYISRAGKKDPSKTLEDLSKARWYLDREIENFKAKPVRGDWCSRCAMIIMQPPKNNEDLDICDNCEAELKAKGLPNDPTL